MKTLNQIELQEVVITDSETTEGINELQKNLERTLEVWKSDSNAARDLQLCKDLLLLNKAVSKISIAFCEEHDIDFANLTGAVKRLSK